MTGCTPGRSAVATLWSTRAPAPRCSPAARAWTIVLHVDLRGSMIVRATLNGQYLDVRRLPDLSPIETRLGSFQWDMLTFAISTDGRRIAFATVEPTGAMMVHILDIASGDESIEPIPWPNEGATPSFGMAFTADDRTLLIGDEGGGITEIDVATRTVSPSRFEGMHGPVVGLWPLRDGRLVAVSHDGTMSIYDAASGRPLGPPMVWTPRVDRVRLRPADPGPRHPPRSRPRPARAAAVEHRPFNVAGGGLPTSRTQPHARRMDPVHARR